MPSLIPISLRRHRIGLKKTLEVLSGFVGLSPQHLSEIESGKCDPRLSTIEKIAAGMGLALMMVSGIDQTCNPT